MRIAFLVIAVIILVTCLAIMPPDSYLYPSYQGDRHTFTWISKVTPELARWARDMNFTDAVVSESRQRDCLHLADVGITYWFCVSSYSFTRQDLANITNAKKKLVSFLGTSPNGYVYLDDTQYILKIYGTTALDNVLSAIREIQSENSQCQFILNGYMNLTDSYKSHIFYSQVNMSQVAFDVYQPLTSNYDSIMPYLEQANSESLGYYIWAYGCWKGGVSWDTMTDHELNVAYRQAMDNNVSRLVIWNGYTPVPGNYTYEDQCLNASCLYYHPEWWDKVRTKNSEFLKGQQL